MHARVAALLQTGQRSLRAPLCLSLSLLVAAHSGAG